MTYLDKFVNTEGVEAVRLLRGNKKTLLFLQVQLPLLSVADQDLQHLGPAGGCFSRQVSQHFPRLNGEAHRPLGLHRLPGVTQLGVVQHGK